MGGLEVDVSLQEVVSKLERENGELRGELNKYNNAQVIVLVIWGWRKGGGVDVPLQDVVNTLEREIDS